MRVCTELSTFFGRELRCMLLCVCVFMSCGEHEPETFEDGWCRCCFGVVYGVKHQLETW